MEKQDKATGWKVPLIFCFVILVCVALGSLLIPEKEEFSPDLPASLLEKAKSTIIELSDRDPEKWKDRLISAGGGFAPAGEKDKNLARLIGQALEARRFDVSCRAAVFMTDGDLREEMLQTILTSARERCEDLHWGVFAIHGSHDRQKAEEMAKSLRIRWQDCKQAGAM